MSGAATTVLGIDIGGSGIKGAPVDIDSGTLAGDRFRVKTPEGGRPDEMLDAIAEVVDHFDVGGPLGVTFPGVVTAGTVRTAVNLDGGWVGVDLAALVRERTRRDVVTVNDADAAAVAEACHGAAKGVAGVAMLLTFGTGVGSGLLVDGTLVPNTELGHLELDGKDAETVVAASVREREDLSWKKWAKRVDTYLAVVVRLFTPSLVVVGGGVTKHTDDWLTHLETPDVVPAHLGNEAGIVGAAMLASGQG